MTEPRLDEELGGVTEVTPPEKPAAKPKSPRRKKGRLSERETNELRNKLEHFFSEIVAPLVTAADEYDGSVIANKAGALADSYAMLARESPFVRGVINSLMASGGPAAAAIVVTASAALPILHHHRVISLPPIAGIPMIGVPLEMHDEATEPGGNNGGSVRADAPESSPHPLG